MSNAKLVDGEFLLGDMKPVSREFQIKQSAHAIHVLSTSLYSRPIEAIVRELSCNALDAHTAACNPGPFHAHLSTVYDNGHRQTSFAIEDFGTGLPPDDLERLYSTYFDSTKEQGDGFIGSFGLGSKSPFAYTKKFFIVNQFFGVKYTYKAEVDEDTCVPSLEKISEEKANGLGNGVIVYFQVQDKDVDAFRKAAQTVYKFFGEKVELYGNMWNEDRYYTNGFNKVENPRGGNQWAVPYPEMVIDLPTVFIQRASLSSYHREDSGVLLNNVMYRLDLKRFTDIPECLAKSTFGLRMPVGSVDVTPSREEIHYSKRSIQALDDAISQAAVEVTSFVQKELNQLDDFQLRMKYHEFRDSFGASLIPEKFQRNDVWFKTNNSYGVPEHVLWTSSQAYRRGEYVQKLIQTDCTTFAYSANITNHKFVILQSEKDRPRTRIAHFFSDAKKDQNVYVFDSQAAFDKFAADLFLTPEMIATQSIKLEDMPKPPRAKRAKRGTVKVQKLFELLSNGNLSPVEESIEDIEDPAVYMPLMHWKVFLNDIKYDAAVVVSAIRPHVEEGTRFFGVKLADIPTLAKLDGWIDVTTALEDAAADLVERLKDQPVYTGTTSCKVESMVSLALDMEPDLAELESVQAFYTAASGGKTVNNMISQHRTILRYLPHSSPSRETGEVATDLADLVDAVTVQFPMLALYLDSSVYISSSNLGHIRATVKNYVRELLRFGPLEK